MSDDWDHCTDLWIVFLGNISEFFFFSCLRNKTETKKECRGEYLPNVTIHCRQQKSCNSHFLGGSSSLLRVHILQILTLYCRERIYDGISIIVLKYVHTFFLWRLWKFTTPLVCGWQQISDKLAETIGTVSRSLAFPLGSVLGNHDKARQVLSLCSTLLNSHNTNCLKGFYLIWLFFR